MTLFDELVQPSPDVWTLQWRVSRRTVICHYPPVQPYLEDIEEHPDVEPPDAQTPAPESKQHLERACSLLTEEDCVKPLNFLTIGRQISLNE